MKAEKNRISEGYHFDSYYIEKGKYYYPVKRYMEEFPNIKIMFYEDFNKDSISFLHEICEFLDIKKFNFKEIPIKNKSGFSNSKFLVYVLKGDFFIKRLLKKFIPKNYLSQLRSLVLNINLKKEKPKITFKEFKFALNLIIGDIKKLEKLLNKDLSHWKKHE